MLSKTWPEIERQVLASDLSRHLVFVKRPHKLGRGAVLDVINNGASKTMEPPLDVQPTLKRYALKLTRDEGRAEDLVQDTYMSMLSKADRAGPIKQPCRYMMSVMHNLFIDQIRREKRMDGVVPLEDVNAASHEASVGLKLTCRETLGAMAGLSPELRAVLIRHGCQGQSYDEIAREMDIPIGTVMSRMARARAALCARMGVRRGCKILDEID